jgi:hypothetical protein
MKGFALLAAALGLGFALAGCAADEPTPPETKESQQAAQTSAQAWSPEKVEAFSKANAEARGKGTGAGQGATTPGESK